MDRFRGGDKSKTADNFEPLTNFIPDFKKVLIPATVSMWWFRADRLADSHLWGNGSHTSYGHPRRIYLTIWERYQSVANFSIFAYVWRTSDGLIGAARSRYIVLPSFTSPPSKLKEVIYLTLQRQNASFYTSKVQIMRSFWNRYVNPFCMRCP